MKNMITKTLIVLSVLVLTLAAFFYVSPYPGVWVIRYSFNKMAVETNEKLEAFVPAHINSKLDISYDDNDSDALLDVYYPADVSNDQLPVIVWTHGGGLISGKKSDLANYCKILASKGYTVVSIDYTIAPEAKYPTPIRQLNKALKFISANPGKFKADVSKIILAGDSGGSMIAASAAAVITNKSYSEVTKVKPGIDARQLKGLLLYCGIYDVNDLNMEGDFGKFLKTVMWAYFGKKDITNNAYAKTAAVIDYVNSNFPPVFISAGNKDPLLEQSLQFSNALKSNNVCVDTLFFTDEQLNLGHEYQFTMDAYGELALEKSLLFLESITK